MKDIIFIKPKVEILFWTEYYYIFCYTMCYLKIFTNIIFISEYYFKQFIGIRYSIEEK